MAGPWSLTGDYFEACNCDIACPCVFGGDPTKGSCTVLIGWHIKKGKSGTTSLDGLSFAWAAYSPGNMGKTKWDVAIYIDERATPAQRKALQPIVVGQEGGPFGALAPAIGKLLGVRFVPIEFKMDGKKRTLRISGAGDMSSEGITGTDGGVVRLAGAQTLAPEVMVARTEHLRLTDHGLKWESSGGNSFYSQVDYKGP